MVKVSNLKSPRTGRAVPNQFRIMQGRDLFFKSYDSIIVKICKDLSVILDKKYWDYSNTTRKYRNEFLGESSQEIKAKVQAGIYKLQNLNK